MDIKWINKCYNNIRVQHNLSKSLPGYDMNIALAASPFPGKAPLSTVLRIKSYFPDDIYCRIMSGEGVLLRKKNFTPMHSEISENGSKLYKNTTR